MELKDQGNTAYKAGRYADAFGLYTAALEKEADVTLLLNRMSAAMALRWYSRAFADGKMALAMDASNPKAVARTANVLLAVGQLTAARTLLAASPSNNVIDPSKVLLERLQGAEAKLFMPVETLVAVEASELFAGTAFAAADAHSSLEKLMVLLQLAPHSELYVLAFVNCLVGARRYEAAQNVLTVLLSAQKAGDELSVGVELIEDSSFSTCWRSPPLPVPKIMLARLTAFSGNFTQALSTIATILREDPDGSTTQASQALHLSRTLKACSACKDKANEMYKAGKFAESAEAYNALLHDSTLAGVCPATILSNLAAALLAADKAKDALLHCNASLKIHPFQSKIWARRATCLERLKPVQHDHIVESLYLAQRLCPDDASLPGRLFSVCTKVDEASATEIIGHFGSIHPNNDAEASALLGSAAPVKLSKALDIDRPRLQIIDMFATWCGPCKAIAPTFDKLALSYPIAQFIKVDGDKCRSTASALGTRAFPTFIVMVDGIEAARMEGAEPTSLNTLLMDGLSKLKIPPKGRVDHPSPYVVQAVQAADMNNTATRIVQAVASFEMLGI